MKRFNSDPSRTRHEQTSTILGGNLLCDLRDVESLNEDDILTQFSEEDLISSEHSEAESALNAAVAFEPVTSEDVAKADLIFYNVFGINLVSCFTRLILSEKLFPTDFVCQGLAYRCQSILRGSTGVRYLKSWGMFWAAVRNLVKTRGLVAFRDHFCIPALSQLVRFKKQIIQLCGLDEALLGKSGLKSKSVDLWIDSKSAECPGYPLALSVSMDGKKISVTKEGTEDMGGKSKELENEEYDTELERILSLWGKWTKESNRSSLFSLYDILSHSSQDIVNKLVALKTLEDSNTKRQEKNPNLAKYIHVLKSELGIGKDLITKLCVVQSNVISLIAEKRLAGHLLPNSENTDLLHQSNYKMLKQLSAREDSANVVIIDRSVKSQSLFEIPWHILRTHLGNISQIPRGTKTTNRLCELCYLSTDQTFRACGLGTSRPLQDMKNIYQQSHSFPSTLETPEQTDPGIVKSFCATMAPMTFGMNCQIQEVGVFIHNGILALPDFVIADFVDVAQFIVNVKSDPHNLFELDEDSIAKCIVDSYICHSKKGSLVVQYNDLMMTVISVPANNTLAEELLLFCDKYIRADRCLARRNQEISIQQENLRKALLDVKDSVHILGSYPLSNQFCSLNTPNLVSQSVPMKLKELMQEKRKFLSKQARELIAVNVSDMSGNASSSPHTTLAATFLSSVSLKVVGEKCINEVIDMVSDKNCKCINIAVDGESIHFATTLPNGNPGTELSLAKALHKKLQVFSKDNLIRLVCQNKMINIEQKQLDNEEIDDIEDQAVEPDLVDLEESIALVQVSHDQKLDFSLEDIEEMLKAGEGSSDGGTRENDVRQLKIAELRLICLKHIFPLAKKKWLTTHLGQDRIAIFFQDGGKHDYVPCNVFHSFDGYFRTISFDYAHLINLYRESAAKGKLETMGLSPENLDKLSRTNGFEYLRKIIALNNGKLKFDSMNQTAAEMLFSLETVAGLKSMKDIPGAECVEKIAMGLSSLDVSGRSCDERVKSLIVFKNFLIDKNSIFDRLKRPDKKNITNELFMMTLCSIDSHIITYLNLEFFNPRRKSTSTVESLFGQLMMMTDGCSKLNVRQLQDVLQRLTLSNALRLLPMKVRGFEFLGKLDTHMKSYKPDNFESRASELSYPSLSTSKGTANLKNSLFDIPVQKTKNPKRLRTTSPDSFDGRIRQYHYKF